MGIVGIMIEDCSEILVHRNSQGVPEHLSIIGTDKSNSEEKSLTTQANTESLQCPHHICFLSFKL